MENWFRLIRTRAFIIKVNNLLLLMKQINFNEMRRKKEKTEFKNTVDLKRFSRILAYALLACNARNEIEIVIALELLRLIKRFSLLFATILTVKGAFKSDTQKMLQIVRQASIDSESIWSFELLFASSKVSVPNAS